MIILQRRGYSTITFHRNGSNTKWYSVMLQNTLTKEITTYISEDIGNEMFLRFRININIDDGEYYVIVFENPQKLNFYAPANAPKEIDYIQFLANDDQVIMNGKYYLVFGVDKTLEEVKFKCSELLRMGEYKRNNTQYQKESQYIQYNK